MSQFMVLYYAEDGAQPVVTGQQMMADWKIWMDETGAQLIDAGAQFVPGGVEVIADSVEVLKGSDWPAMGYFVLEADSLEAAVVITQKNPSHQHFPGKAIFRVQQIGQMPNMG